MPATDFLVSAIGNHVIGGTPYTAPTELYLALYTVAPDREGGGTEVTGGGYVRSLISFDETLTSGEFENTSANFIDMPEVTVVALGIHDDDTAGNLLYFETFSPVSVAEDDSYPVNAGVLIIRHI